MAEGGFKPIGPFDLSRVDMVVAGNVLGFILGTWKMRLWTFFLFGVLLIGFAAGVISKDRTLTIYPPVLLFLVFFGGPWLRSTARSKMIVVSEGLDGLQVETSLATTTYRWQHLGKTSIIFSRLFVMIDGNRAIVIPERATTRGNLEAAAERIAIRAHVFG